MVGLAVSSWIARYLGPTQQGILVFITSYIAVFQVIAELGTTNIVIRKMAREPDKSGKILASITHMRFISSFACLVSAIALMWFWKPQDTQSIILTSIIGAAMLFQAADTVDLWFQSQSQSKRTVTARTIAFLISNLVKISLLLASAPLLAFAIAITLEFGVAAGGLLYGYRRFPTRCKWQFDSNELKIILCHSVPFLLSGCINIISINIDKLIIFELLNSRQAGIYGAAFLLIGSASVIPYAISSSTAPYIARCDDTKKRNKIFENLYFALWWSALFLLPILFFLSDYIVLILFGDAYSDASGVLRILSFALIPIFLSLGNDYLSLMQQKGRMTLYRTLFGLSTLLAMLLVFTPTWGINGAAIALLISHTVSNTIFFWLLMPDSMRLQLRGLTRPMINLFTSNN